MNNKEKRSRKTSFNFFVIAALEPLDKAALVRILKEPKNALLKQYEKLFAYDGVELVFEDEAIEAIEDEVETSIKTFNKDENTAYPKAIRKFPRRVFSDIYRKISSSF